jgi:adenosine deaminase
MRALADLHRHLDGSLRESTLREDAARAGHDARAPDQGPARFPARQWLDSARDLR